MPQEGSSEPDCQVWIETIETIPRKEVEAPYKESRMVDHSKIAKPGIGRDEALWENKVGNSHQLYRNSQKTTSNAVDFVEAVV